MPLSPVVVAEGDVHPACKNLAISCMDHAIHLVFLYQNTTSFSDHFAMVHAQPKG
jgi:hypothetical protein